MEAVIEQITGGIVAVTVETIVGECGVLVLIGPARGKRLLQEVTPGIVGEAQSPARLIGRGQYVSIRVVAVADRAGFRVVRRQQSSQRIVSERPDPPLALLGRPALLRDLDQTAG